MFGPSGVGKTHLGLCCGSRRRRTGRSGQVLCRHHPGANLAAGPKRQLLLPNTLKKNLTAMMLLIIDDLGYVKKSEAETSVLFELIAHR